MTELGTRALVGLLALTGCTASEAYVPASVAPQKDAVGKVARPRAEPAGAYLVVTPPRFEGAITPLLTHRRKQGHAVQVVSQSFSDPEALRGAILAERRRSHGALRYVLLVGDAAPPDEAQEDRLPTFYLPKLDYFSESGAATGGRYPSDAPYAEVDGHAALSIGRLPARAPDEVEGYVKKVIRYETSKVTGAWPRRIVMRAGTANFGDFTDAAIESMALGLLDDAVSYDFDLDFTFGKAGSDYAYPPDRLGERLLEDVRGGALFFAFVGHSGTDAFQSMQYRYESASLGTSEDFGKMAIAEGAPVLVSLSCDAGAFDMADGRRSIAEAAVLNPSGPVASFASSRVSHPYPNLLLGEAFIASFLAARPKTLGDGLVALEEDMVGRSALLGELLTVADVPSLKREHIALYNLFGDPALRLRYPEVVEVSASGAAEPGGEIVVSLGADIAAGEALVTLETRRSVVHHALERDLDAMPLGQALAAMAANHDRANDKTLEKKTLAFERTAKVSFRLPDSPGKLVVKAFVRSKDGRRFAAGHTFVTVGQR
jgi:hypothetical protein